jgi:exodeoxyribonuclease VII small subunit
MPKQAPDETQPTFETAMERLEAIVDEMEDGKVPLETLLVRYEEGMKLVKICQARLTEAEEKIEMITRNNGKPALKPFETRDTPAEAASETKHDDVRLF